VLFAHQISKIGSVSNFLEDDVEIDIEYATRHAGVPIRFIFIAGSNSDVRN